MSINDRNPTIYINTLGEFSITIGNNSINDRGSQAKKPWCLLEYLVTFRNKEIGLNELTDLFWRNDNSQNPQGALKTLLCRVRKLLTPLGYPPQSLLTQRRGSYAWTPDFETVVDADRFEELAIKALAEDLSEDVLKATCLAALDLYKGDFLPKSAAEDWVIPISTYYHSLYQKVVHKTVELLSRQDNQEKIIEVCQKGVQIEPFDEDIHYHLIYALFTSGNQNGALEHYTQTVDMFYNEFSITPSERLKELYKIIQDKEHGINTDLSLIQKSLQEETASLGAYYCEYAVFKDIYQLQRRTVERTGDSIYLCLITISDLNGNLFKSNILVKAMNELEEAIRTSLRRGDVYTRYSISQYMFLLPTASYENGEKVLKRIIHNFRKGYSRKNMIINHSLQLVTPLRKG